MNTHVNPPVGHSSDTVNDQNLDDSLSVVSDSAAWSTDLITNSDSDLESNSPSKYTPYSTYSSNCSSSHNANHINPTALLNQSLMTALSSSSTNSPCYVSNFNFNSTNNNNNNNVPTTLSSSTNFVNNNNSNSNVAVNAVASFSNNNHNNNQSTANLVSSDSVKKFFLN